MRAEYNARVRKGIADGVARGDNAAIERRVEVREADRVRRERHETNARAASDARVRGVGLARTPAEAHKALHLSRLEHDKNVRAARANGTRANIERAEISGHEVDEQSARMFEVVALAREANMWSPATFHRASPMTLHRHLERARQNPPPREAEVVCYVPRDVAAAAGYARARANDGADDQGANDGADDRGDGVGACGLGFIAGGRGMSGADDARDEGREDDDNDDDARAHDARPRVSVGRWRTYVEADAADPWERAGGHPSRGGARSRASADRPCGTSTTRSASSTTRTIAARSTAAPIRAHSAGTRARSLRATTGSARRLQTRSRCRCSASSPCP